MPNDADRGKTYDNPLPFTSWDEFVELCNNEQGIKYLYFDNTDRQQMNWDNITLDYQIEGSAIRYVDWRGNYIRNLNIDLPYNDDTKDRKQYDAMPEMAFVFKDQELGFGMHWCNLEVENMYVSDPRVALFRRWNVIHSCWFHNIVVTSKLDGTSAYWTTQHGDNVCPFGVYCNVSKSIINFHSQNIAPRIPAMKLYDSLLTVDYKWTMSGTPINSNGLFVRRYPSANNGFYAYNSIVEGVIDLSKSTGNIDDFYLLCNDLSGYNQSSGINGILASESGQSVTLNLKIKNSQHSKVNIEHFSFGDTYKTSTVPPTYIPTEQGGHPKECIVVINNGDGYNDMDGFYSNRNTAHVLDFYAEGWTRYNLMSPDYLDDMDYSYIADDGTRYSVIYNDFYSAYPETRQPDFLFYPQSDPLWVKRKNPAVNNQYPFLPFETYPIRQMPVNNGAVSKSENIIIYDMQTNQDEFDNNGLAVLTPTSCRIVEELNGAYNLTMTHPADEEGKYKYILEMNIIKALGQLFVINRVEEVTTGNSHYVTCYAEHITYTLNDRWIFPPFTVAGYHGQTLIDSIMAQSFYFDTGWQTQYAFTVTSDLDAEDTYDDWKDIEEGTTPYDMFIGTNGLVSRLGGELYRDNFTMSINKRMQGAQDNAFEIKVGYNCTGIKRTVDITTFATYLKAYPVVNGEFDENTWFAVAWDPSTLPRAFPREIIRSVNFHYKDASEVDKLGRDCMAYFGQVCEPIVSYEFNMKDLRRNPEYADFENHYRFKVGDTGRVWDERLQAWTNVQISRTEKDGITGDTTKVIIGNTRSFTRPNSYNPLTPNNYHISADTVLEGEPPLEFDADGSFLSDWEIFGAAGGVGDLTNEFDYSTWYTTLMTHTVTAAGKSYTGMVGGTITPVTNGFTMTADGRISTAMTLSADYPMNGMGIPISVESGQQYTLSWEQDVDRANSYVYIYNGTTQVAGTSAASDRSFNFTAPSSTLCILIVFANASASPNSVTYTNFVLAKAGSSYTIPVKIWHDANHEQTVVIPVAQPLGEGNSISLAGSEIDIPTYNGFNRLIIETTVQPDKVKIRYRQPEEQENQGN